MPMVDKYSPCPKCGGKPTYYEDIVGYSKYTCGKCLTRYSIYNDKAFRPFNHRDEKTW